MKDEDKNESLNDLKQIMSCLEETTSQYLTRLDKENEKWRTCIENITYENQKTHKVRTICTTIVLIIILSIYLLGYFFSPYLYNHYSIEGDNSNIINGENNSVEAQ
jgi:hypothetical protein